MRRSSIVRTGIPPTKSGISLVGMIQVRRLGGSGLHSTSLRTSNGGTLNVKHRHTEIFQRDILQKQNTEAGRHVTDLPIVFLQSEIARTLGHFFTSSPTISFSAKLKAFHGGSFNTAVAIVRRVNLPHFA